MSPAAPPGSPEFEALLHAIRFPGDADPLETREWLDALATLVRTGGPERARFVLNALQDEARRHALAWQPQRQTPYVNTISLQDQAPFPGQLEIEQKLAAIMRWNALAMVVRANQRQGELGGHISSYASAADLFEVGFNHFFRARVDEPGGHGGDLVFFQPHSAPGVYARAFLEGRLSEAGGARPAPGGRHGARLELLPAPLADARLLAVPDRFHGPGATVGGVSGPVHALPGTPRPDPAQ